MLLPRKQSGEVLSLKCVKFPPSLIMWSWVEPGGYSPHSSNISAFSMAQACNILVPTERSEARRIPKPGLQHSWISEQCSDLIAWPPTALCQIPSSRPDTPESNIRLHHEILRQEWVIGYWASVRTALHTHKHRSFTQTGLSWWINRITERKLVISAAVWFSSCCYRTFNEDCKRQAKVGDSFSHNKKFCYWNM